ncbi:MAG: hypothetical protein ACTHZ5_10940 [Micrococcaceae bacterium]
MSTSPRRIPARLPAYSTEATARQLQPAPVGTPSPRSAPRTPLRVVPEQLRSTPKWMIASCVGALLVALLTVLMVNITISNRQYELVELRSSQQEITQANEALAQQVAHVSAPQNVASEAVKLGMVLPGATASIDLETGTVTGVATTATDENKPTGFVGAPTVASGQGTPAKAPAQEQAAASDTEASVEAPTADTASESNENSGASEDTAANAGSAGSGQADLNGGTLQAPQMSQLGG